MTSDGGPRIHSIAADAYLVPTATGGKERPESDGTITWSSTGVLVVRLSAGGETGLGYAYTSPAALGIVRGVLSRVVLGADPPDTARTFWAMARSVRNAGWPGVGGGRKTGKGRGSCRSRHAGGVLGARGKILG